MLLKSFQERHKHVKKKKIDLTLEDLDKNLIEEINSATRPNLDLMALIKQNIECENMN